MTAAALHLLVVPQQRTRAWPLHQDAPACVSYPLADALMRDWQSDAHVAAYEAPAARRRLSINGDGGRRFYDRGVTARMALLVVDIDAPKHVAADDTWRAEQAALVAALRDEHPGVVGYDTRGGYRLLARLATPHEITNADSAAAWARWYLRTLAYLSRRFGIVGDPACHDWTRLYRLPHATRARPDGRPGAAPERRATHGALDAVGTWCRPSDDDADDAELRRLADQGGTWAKYLHHVAAPPERAPRARAARARTPDTNVVQIPAVAPLAAAVAAAVAALPAKVGAHHRARLAVVATLRSHGWSRVMIERVVGALADASGKRRGELVAELVPSTLARVDADEPAVGEAYLRSEAPRVHEALAPYIDSGAEQWLRRLGALVPPHLVSRDEAAATMRDTYARARADAGLVQVQCTAGAGKTRAAVHEAVVAARSGKRTALLAPSHAVAREILAELAAAGVAAHHLVSVASHMTGDAPTCRHHEAARSLAGGTVPIVPTLCEGYGYGARAPGQRHLPVIGHEQVPHAPCEHRDTCDAYSTAKGGVPDGVLVLVGVHQHAATAHRWLRDGGAHGLLVVDEAPRLLDAERWSGAELLSLAEQVQRCVVSAEREWRAEMFRAAAHGLRVAPDAGKLRDVLVAGLVAQRADAAAAAATVATWGRNAVVDAYGRERGSLTPRPARSVLVGLRRGQGMPTHAARTLRACGLLARALAHETGAAPDRVLVGVAVRDWGADAGAHELRVGAVVEPLAGVLCDPSIGRVLLDATADPRLVEPYTGRIERVVLAVADGAQVQRVFVPWSHGTRRHLLDRTTGAVRWHEAAAAMREAVTLAAEQVQRGGTLAVVGYQAVIAELRRAWAAPDEHEQAAGVLAALRARGITPAWGYYGALRGRNDWRHADGLVCLGTPYPPVAEIEQVAAAVGLDGAVRDVGLHEARAELEQAVARLRAPQRTTATVVVVLATQPPLRADSRWSVRALATGRPPAADAAELVTLAERMGVAAAARVAGVAERTVQRARAGVRTSKGGVTQDVADTPPATGCVTPPPDTASHPAASPPRGGAPPPSIRLRASRLAPTPPADDPPPAARTACGGCTGRRTSGTG